MHRPPATLPRVAPSQQRASCSSVHTVCSALLSCSLPKAPERSPGDPRSPDVGGQDSTRELSVHAGIKRLKNRKKLGSNIPTSEPESLCPTTQQQLSLVAACVGSGWTPTCSETTGRQEIKSAAIKFSLLVCLKSCCTILEKKGNLSWFINAL